MSQTRPGTDAADAGASGRTLLGRLKREAGSTSPEFAISVGAPPRAILRVVATDGERLNLRDVRCLTDWRNRFVRSFLTEFEATEARTADWLATTVGPDPTKILFMIDDPTGNPIGYMGIAFIDWRKSYAEADAIVRGAEAPRGLMTSALRTLLNFAEEKLGLVHLGVRVRSDNAALQFYEKFGFREIKRVLLRRETRGSEIHWLEDAGNPVGTPQLVHLRLASK